MSAAQRKYYSQAEILQNQNFLKYMPDHEICIIQYFASLLAGRNEKQRICY